MKHSLGLLGRWAATLLLVAVAIVVALSVWKRHEKDPWTRDGHVRADVVRVSSDIGGLVTKVLVHDNERVRAGQLLFILDGPRHKAALGQANAAIQSAKANIQSATANLELARREAKRDIALGNLVATETHEQSVAKVETALAALAQANASSNATLLAREVALLNIQRTEVHASVDGIVTNLDLHSGDFLPVGAQAMALVDTDSIRVEGYFEETKLRCLRVGDKATVRLMGEEDDLVGHVASIAAGIADDQRSNTHNLLPAVQPTFSWVRLAQRIPVRIHIDKMPTDTLFIAGRTATVRIDSASSGSCK
ncbi:HlyD family efflux transporter periplasmic adaptor subunit [Cupriavidus sp. YAF13]|uniref:HlyD family efflux transporter periplasmic adaptor subunit n=1 Tax=Cupriavidus sp. YAF13 TaxID=3233075 RepID=UPI003F914308